MSNFTSSLDDPVCEGSYWIQHSRIQLHAIELSQPQGKLHSRGFFRSCVISETLYYRLYGAVRGEICFQGRIYKSSSAFDHGPSGGSLNKALLRYASYRQAVIMEPTIIAAPSVRVWAQRPQPQR